MKEEDKDLNYWKENAKDAYMTTPICVLRYITELEKAVKNNAVLPLVSGSASDRYRKALDYISEMTFEIEIGTEKGSDVLEKALRIASGYDVD